MELAVETLTATDWETERTQLVSERDEARTALSEFEEAAAIALQRQIETAVEGIRRELTAECEQSRQLLADTEEAAGIALEHQVAAAIERFRNEQAAESEALRAECLKLTADLSEANQFLAEMKEAYRQELSEHKADDEKWKQLVQELHKEKAAKALPVADNPAATAAAIRTETARVEASIQELSNIIDNAETGLSDVIRKTVERSQLESYVKGLWFSSNLPA